MTTWVAFARHDESTKNLADRFARSGDDDELTMRGMQGAVVLGHELREFAEFLEAESVEVHASTAQRVVASAKHVAEQLECPLHVDARLSPLISPMTAGLSFDEFALKSPRVARQINLYRGGLLNSYDIASIGESTYPFERQVRAVVDDMATARADLVVLIANRSVLTSALINIARLSTSYPGDFFGIVPLDHGSVGLASLDDGAWTLHFANLPSTKLNTLGRLLVRP